MNEQLQSLYMRHDQLMFVAPHIKDRNRVVHDVQYIHDPLASKLGRTFRARFRNHFDLHAQPRDKARALFEANISRNDMDSEIKVQMDSMDRASQAAGWSALQLYREKTGGLFLPHLDAIDPSMDTGNRAVERRFSLFREAKAEASTSVFQLSGPLYITSNPQTMRSEVRVHSAEDQSLPDILQIIKTGYDELYPDANTSEAVANIVGARNLEEFTEAWQRAGEHEPVTAARTLLESDVFLFDKHS